MHKSDRQQTVVEGVDVISIRSDRTFPRHTHDEFGFGYIVQGGQKSWSSRGLVEAGCGDVITVNPAELHDGIGRKGQPRYWRMLFLRPEVITKYYETSFSEIEFYNPVIRSEKSLNLVKAAISATYLDDIDPEETDQLIMLALDCLVGQIVRGRELSEVHSSTEVRVVLDMIRQNWDAPLSLSDFSYATGLSRFQILRRFSNELGTTPHAYLTQHRVKRAKQLIVEGSSLAETAVASGFSDQSHLTRAFSKQLGITPGRFLSSVAP